MPGFPEAPLPLPDTWQPVATLRPADLTAVPQAAILMGNGDWVVSQDFDGARLVLSRFSHDGTYLSSMTVLSDDHGDRLEARGNNGEVVGLYVGGYPGGTWCELPWVAGRTWTQTEALRYRSVRAKVPFGARAWFQGEINTTIVNGAARTIRFYGVPYKPDGPSLNPQGIRNPDIPAVLEFYKPGSSAAVATEDLSHLGRDDNGAPIGGRLEPEGLSLGTLNDQRVLLVGVAVGPIGGTYMQVYAKPL